MRALVTGSIAALLLALADRASGRRRRGDHHGGCHGADGRPFPHFWERMFGSGRAALTLRESYRDDLRAVQRDCAFLRPLSRHLQ